MALDQIKALYSYNRWANGRIFDVAFKLSPEQYTRDMRNSYGSVRDTLVHIISCEWIWLLRVKGTSPRALWSPSDFPTVSALKTSWLEIAREQTEFIEGLTEESLKAPITYVNLQGQTFTYSLWQILQHVVNHSSYHRGQVTTLLRQLDCEPIATDFLVYYDMTKGLADENLG